MKSKRFMQSVVALVLFAFATTALAGGGHNSLNNGVKAVPVFGKMSGEVTFIPFFPQFPGDTGPCEGYNFLQDPATGEIIPGSSIQTLSTTKGQLARIGRLTLDTTHCAQYTSDGNSEAKAGPAAFMTETGDMLYGTYEAVPLSPPVLPIGGLIIQEGVTDIIGGTGIFAGASGKLTFRVYVVFEGFDDWVWPLEYVISGLVHVPE